MLISDEVALRRGIGGPEAFKAQLEHLEATTRQRNITFQVVPATTAYAGLAGAFTIMSFIEDPDVAFVDGANSNGQFIDRPDMVAGLMETYDLIRSAASPAAQTAYLIKEIRESLLPIFRVPYGARAATAGMTTVSASSWPPCPV